MRYESLEADSMRGLAEVGVGLRLEADLDVGFQLMLAARFPDDGSLSFGNSNVKLS
jgi:hypothetical protein